MTAQDIINAVTNDVRQVLSNVTDTAVIVPWVDRIQKDALHTSLWNNLLQQTQNISVVSGTPSYNLVLGSGVSIRRVSLVYDRSFDRILTPVDNIDFPMAKADEQGNQSPNTNTSAMLTATTMLQWPEYYKRINGSTIVLYPAPQKTVFNGTYEIYYEINAPDIAANTDTLLIPNDGKDLVVAGVNSYICQYLHLDTESQFWKQEYEAMKKGIMTQ